MKKKVFAFLVIPIIVFGLYTNVSISDNSISLNTIEATACGGYILMADPTGTRYCCVRGFGSCTGELCGSNDPV